jgi:hypothetical protein
MRRHRFQGYLPRIRQLYRRHSGITRSLSAAYEEAASVCLQTQAPPTPFSIWCPNAMALRLLRWHVPSLRQQRAWANETDRIAAAAYGVALAAVESELGLVTVGRAQTLSGADYYVSRPDDDDYLESAYRLEVSGTASAEVRRAQSRLQQKVRQVAHPRDPSLACVVSFGTRRILIQEA